ncbi:hypothetical protein HK097_010045 [Rhizophlyctis rosea]|uniref:NIPSNAP domain-containing protein n=1 Tax=Rhizophlyctis rosea TaxID=64517 RepID=A0AAD5SAX8_9FUNG|nr:hypothetical protein HK097_010045 [Rhizophlyctis rosea]
MIRTARLLPVQPQLLTQTRFRGLTLSVPRLNEPTGTVEPGHAGPPHAAAPTTTASKAKSIVSSILHGSEAAKTEVAETHSKLLARGKYVHELQIHNVKSEAMEDYIGLVGQNYPKVAQAPELQVKLFGSWITEFGELDQAVHIWEYNNYPGYIDTSNRLREDQSYKEFERKLRPMLRSRSNQMLLEFAFWQGSPPAVHDGIYELRSYLLKPGKMLEWETEWRRGLEARRKFVQPIGAWFSQLGALNYVHHMWVYPDLQARKQAREKAWQVDGWSQTVYNTGWLIHFLSMFVMRSFTK